MTDSTPVAPETPDRKHPAHAAPPLPARTTIALAAAAVSAGFATGLLTGLTAVDATVVTAVVSALLAGIGVAIAAIAYFRVPHRTVSHCALLSALLAVSMVAGTQTGLYS